MAILDHYAHAGRSPHSLHDHLRRRVMRLGHFRTISMCSSSISEPFPDQDQGQLRIQSQPDRHADFDRFGTRALFERQPVSS